MGILDLLFPKYCVNCKLFGSYICANCFPFISFDTNTICLVCNRGAIDGLTHPGCKKKYTIDGAFSAISYKGVVKKLIYQFKYKPYVSDLTEILTDLFFESLIQQEPFDRASRTKPTIVPIPLHPSKLQTRGYNHAKILAEGLSKKLKLPTAQLLIRTKKTHSQVGLKKEDRKVNIKNAFSPTPNILVSQYRTVFLVDDILTSGATMLEGASVLKRSGVKNVWGLALAKD